VDPGLALNYTYDADGNQTSSTDLGGHTTTYTYNYLDQRIAQADAIGNPPTTYQYDAEDHQVQVSDPMSNVTQTSYDGDGRVTHVTQPATPQTSYVYDLDGNKKSYTDAGGGTTSNVYNDLDQLASQTTPPSQTNPSGDTTTYTYDPDGRPYTTKDPQGRTTTATYNPVGQPSATTYSDGETGETYSYYPTGTQTGRLYKLTDASGTTTYTYDLDGRTSSITNGAGLALSYLYNPDSELSSLTYPGNAGDTVTYNYNQMDQEISLKDWLANTTSFGYDTAGRLNTVTLPNGITESTAYDKDSLVSSISDTSGANTVASFNYASPTPRNADEELMSETDTGTPGPSAQSYTYDALHRVTSDNSSSYGYNAQSQLTTGPGGATQALYPAGELCWSMANPPPGSTCSATPSGATAYTFNQEGQRTQSAAPSSSTTYAWNEHGELTSTTTGANTVGYTYNGAGLLSARTQGSASANFVWDPVEGTNPLLVDDGTNYYIYGPDGLATEQISVSSGTPDYYLHDQLGSTRALTSSSGAVVSSWTYNAWGQTVATGSGSGGGGTTTTTAATTTTTAATTTTTVPPGTTISAVGSLAADTQSSTLSVSPVTNGDIEVLSVMAGPASATQVSSITGGGVSTWSSAIAYPGDSNDANTDVELWWGVVTSTGASTITAHWAHGTPSWTELAAQEFSAGTGATWSVDKTGSSSSATSTVTFPSLSPSGSSGELYFGYGVPTGTSSAGSTPGFVYDIPIGNVVAYDTDTTATADPTAGQSSTGSGSVAALFMATGGGGGTTTTTPLLWAGQYQDPTTGLYYMRARWYDPATAEFSSVDPAVAQTGQPYAYAGDDPVNENDPSGTNTEGYCAEDSASFIAAGATASDCILKTDDGTSIGYSATIAILAGLNTSQMLRVETQIVKATLNLASQLSVDSIINAIKRGFGFSVTSVWETSNATDIMELGGWFNVRVHRSIV
jgi:RHS repeat-associated protein